MQQWYIWLIIIIILVVLEAVTASVSPILFALSALATLLISLFIDNFVIQFLLFLILGLLFNVVVGPIIVRKIKTRKIVNNSNNKIGLVIEKITKSTNGKVKVNGKVYEASANTTIPAGSTIKVIDEKNEKLVVENINN